MKRNVTHQARGLALAAAMAAAATVGAALASSGSAQPSGTTLHLVAITQANVGFFPRHRPRQGDRVGFGDAITGDATGFDRGTCTVIAKNALCNVEVKLSNGTLSAQGFAPLGNNRNQPYSIIGGTGAYDGARGTALVTDLSSTKARYTVQLLP